MAKEGGAKEGKERERIRRYGGGTSLGRYEGDAPLTRGGVGASPFSLMRRLAEDMDRVFEDFGFGGPALARGGPDSLSMWSPEIETLRRGDQLVLRADLPGMDRDNVNVEIEEDTLIISGERQDEYKEERDDFYRSERSYGRFFRAIPLPEGVDPDQCNATFKDGVLEVTVPVPKHAEREHKRIEIK